VFCTKPIQKIVRHLERYHGDKPEVKKFMAMPKKSEARKAVTSKLRLAGNHQHNIKSEGDLIVARRTATSAAEVVLCVNCLGYYAKESLYRHKCPVVKNSPTGPVRKPGSVRAGRQLFSTARKDFSSEGAEIFAAMTVDDISEAVKNDVVARELLELQLQKGEGSKFQWRKQIRHKLRLLGRFVLEARKLLPGCHSLEDILTCQNFLTIAEAAKQCGRGEAGKAEGLTVPVKVGFLVKACAEIIMASAQQKKDLDRAKDAKHLLDNYQKQWGTRYEEDSECLVLKGSIFRSENDITSPPPLPI
jgi:hypothetical protein